VLSGAFGRPKIPAWHRALRKLSPDPALFRRRAAGESLRALAREYDVAHTSLSRDFATEEGARRLLEAAQELAAERARHDEKRGSRQPSTARLGFGGVPLFPNTPSGQAERLAYYEARKLNHPPDSIYDYHDVIRGRETPAERRARQRSATGRRR